MEESLPDVDELKKQWTPLFPKLRSRIAISTYKLNINQFSRPDRSLTENEVNQALVKKFCVYDVLHVDTYSGTVA